MRINQERPLRIGLYSDVHGNLEALEVVQQALLYEAADVTICLGDLVGYGPDPGECVRRVLENTNTVVAGNHDFAVTGQISLGHFNRYAREAMIWTRENLDADLLEKLSRLPLMVIEDPVSAVHATPEAPDQWLYLMTRPDAAVSFRSLRTPLCFVGHSHTPAVFVMHADETIALADPAYVTLEPDCRYIINVGSVGQPRDNDPRAAYGVLDTDKKQFHLNRLDYPVDRVQKKMAEAGLPDPLIQRLALGV